MVNKSDRDLFLDRTKKAREERAYEKHRIEVIIHCQAVIRSKIVRKTLSRQALDNFDKLFDNVDQNFEVELAFETARSFLFVFSKNRDQERFLKLSRYILQSLNNVIPLHNYSSLYFVEHNTELWCLSLEKMAKIACQYLNDFKPEIPHDMKSILSLLHLLISLTAIHQNSTLMKSKTDPNLQNGFQKFNEHMLKLLVFKVDFYQLFKNLLIKGLCRCHPSLKTIPLSAIVVLIFRPLSISTTEEFKNEIFRKMLSTLLTVPACLEYVKQIAPEKLELFRTNNVLHTILSDFYQNFDDILNDFDANSTLFFFGNFIQLTSFENGDFFQDSHIRSAIITIFEQILKHCQSFSSRKFLNLTHWHPILGWYSQKTHTNDNLFNDSLNNVKIQLNLLWQSELLNHLLGEPLTKIVNPALKDRIYNSTLSPSKKGFFQKLISNGSNMAAKDEIQNFQDIENQDVIEIMLTASFYHNVLKTFTQLKMNILTGLCYRDNVLYNMWLLFVSLGPLCDYKRFSEKFILNNRIPNGYEFRTLHLFLECMTHFITILDDTEMYENVTSFKINDFIYLSKFVNHFYYEILSDCDNGFEQSVYNLLMILYRRDTRRRYTSHDDHWMIKQFKILPFLTDFLKEKKHAKLILEKMPHIIPLDERIRLLRKFIVDEKLKYGYSGHSSTLIKVHRKRILEDGFRQISVINSNCLKGVIRVGFVNEQGLDEAGIDQDGVFKEFMEEIVKIIFNPELNLFRITNGTHEQRLYPAATSYLQEDHLQLFEFIGKLIAKALYEGFVVDAPFASFFLSQVLGQSQQGVYSAIDELPSLDLELYRNLTFIKHYRNDVKDLQLTFSVNDDMMGQILTHELIPGGNAVSVTNDNKINYIHLMAHFRMHTQIKDQTAAFIRGFRSVICMEWLQMFSTPELQKLIAGDNVPLDFKDLRKHTKYFGGFHDSHKVIVWLWDILIKEFNEKDKGNFLKFVTSSSKSPLLGFSHLEPPFSIRCVEVSDDDDIGDTLGSVIRGFFTIRKSQPLDRLPTSATCFNLLKLPNYHKKHILREKLCYAITCNTGFELS